MEEFLKNIDSIIAEQDESIAAFVRALSGVDPELRVLVPEGALDDFESTRPTVKTPVGGAIRALAALSRAPIRARDGQAPPLT